MPRRLILILQIAAVALATLIIAVQVRMVLRPAEPTIVQSGVGDIAPRFRLTDQTGREVTEQSFLGRPVVYLFGWTGDPDMTPAALQVLVAALERGPPADVVPVFISLDAQRDRPPVLAAHLRTLARPVTGLTATTPEEASDVARSFRLYHRRIDDPAWPGGYRYDHALLFYVFRRDGRFGGVVPYDTDARVVGQEISAIARE